MPGRRPFGKQQAARRAKTKALFKKIGDGITNMLPAYRETIDSRKEPGSAAEMMRRKQRSMEPMRFDPTKLRNDAMKSKKPRTTI